MKPVHNTYLDVAEQLLTQHRRPMSAREVVSLALQQHILSSDGATPWQTMKSKLSTDILNKGEGSRFKRVSQGLFALRTFDNEEFVATRFRKNKLDEEIASAPDRLPGDSVAAAALGFARSSEIVVVSRPASATR